MSPHDPFETTGFDQRVRALHAQSLERLSPRVQAQLAQRRRAALDPRAPIARRATWPWATAAVASLALVMALQMHAPIDERPAAPTIASAPRAHAPTGAGSTAVASLAGDDAGSLLSDDPDFYLWLGSGDAGAANPVE